MRKSTRWIMDDQNRPIRPVIYRSRRKPRTWVKLAAMGIVAAGITISAWPGLVGVWRMIVK